MTELAPTSLDNIDALSQWFAAKTVSTTLKSGLPVIIKRATTEDLVINGVIPVPLVAKYYALADKDLSDLSDPKTVDTLTESLSDLGAYFEAVTHAVLVWPTIKADGDIKKGELPISALSFDDKQEIAQIAERGVQLLTPFPKE